MAHTQPPARNFQSFIGRAVHLGCGHVKLAGAHKLAESGAARRAGAWQRAAELNRERVEIQTVRRYGNVELFSRAYLIAGGDLRYRKVRTAAIEVVAQHAIESLAIVLPVVVPLVEIHV